jgi:hypothetical protein
VIAVRFNRDYAQAVTQALLDGKPIPLPPDGNWSQNNMLTLAGILYATVFSHGPHSHQLAGITQADRERMHAETREAVEETFKQDIHDGIEFLCALTFKVLDNDYDQDHDEDVWAVVFRQDGHKAFRPVKGFKNFPPDA